MGDDVQTGESDGLVGDTTLTQDTSYGEKASRSQGRSITSIDSLLSQPNATALLDRRVDLGRVRVTRAFNDSTVLVTSAESDSLNTEAPSPTSTSDTTMADQILVVLSEDPSGMDTAEGDRAPLQQDQMLSLQGTVKDLRKLDLSQHGISKSDAQEILQEQIYIVQRQP